MLYTGEFFIQKYLYKNQSKTSYLDLELGLFKRGLFVNKGFRAIVNYESLFGLI